MLRIGLTILLPAAIFLAVGCRSTEPEPAKPEQAGPPPLYYALLHSPGPNWREGVKPFDQEGIREHVAHFEAQADAGKLVIGGPFMDGGGGMMILDVGSKEAADAIAQADPAVRAEVLSVQVRPWLVPLARK
jgi:uncharacterized protein YciI